MNTAIGRLLVVSCSSMLAMGALSCRCTDGTGRDVALEGELFQVTTVWTSSLDSRQAQPRCIEMSSEDVQSSEWCRSLQQLTTRGRWIFLGCEIDESTNRVPLVAGCLARQDILADPILFNAVTNFAMTRWISGEVSKVVLGGITASWTSDDGGGGLADSRIPLSSVNRIAAEHHAVEAATRNRRAIVRDALQKRHFVVLSPVVDREGVALRGYLRVDVTDDVSLAFLRPPRFVDVVFSASGKRVDWSECEFWYPRSAWGKLFDSKRPMP